MPSPTPFLDLAAHNTAVVAAVPCRVISLNCHNLNASDRYLMLFDSTTVPINGAVPKQCFPVFAKGALALDQGYFGKDGLLFGAGVAFAISSTETTLTLGAAGDQVTSINTI